MGSSSSGFSTMSSTAGRDELSAPKPTWPPLSSSNRVSVLVKAPVSPPNIDCHREAESLRRASFSSSVAVSVDPVLKDDLVGVVVVVGDVSSFLCEAALAAARALPFWVVAGPFSCSGRLPSDMYKERFNFFICGSLPKWRCIGSNTYFSFFFGSVSIFLSLVTPVEAAAFSAFLEDLDDFLAPVVIVASPGLDEDFDLADFTFFPSTYFLSPVVVPTSADTA